MRFFDLINFDLSQLKHSASFYGFSSIYSSKDVCFVSTKSPVKNDPRLKIFIGDKNAILNNLKKYDVFYSKTYDLSLELFAKAKGQEKLFMLAISDILLSQNLPLTLYKIERFVKVARHYDIDFIFASLAENEYLIRSPYESAFILQYCGLTTQQVYYGYSLLKDLISDK